MRMNTLINKFKVIRYFIKNGIFNEERAIEISKFDHNTIEALVHSQLLVQVDGRVYLDKPLYDFRYKEKYIHYGEILYGLNKNYLSPFTDSFVPNKKSLKSDIAMDEFNLKNNQLDVVDQQKPTFCFYLKNIQCKSIFTVVIFLLILLINADIWSKEFSSTKPYQYIFSYPLKRKCILLIRNMFYCIISLLLVVSFTAVLCFVGYIQYGYGGHLFILTNGSFLEIIQVLLKSFLIFMLSLLMYVQFIQLVSLVLKDEIITWFAVIVILLVSCFVITGWNPFSYILSFNIDFYYEKTVILFFINLLIPFISCVFIENMDFE